MQLCAYWLSSCTATIIPVCLFEYRIKKAHSIAQVALMAHTLPIRFHFHSIQIKKSLLIHRYYQKRSGNKSNYEFWWLWTIANTINNYKHDCWWSGWYFGTLCHVSNGFYQSEILFYTFEDISYSAKENTKLESILCVHNLKNRSFKHSNTSYSWKLELLIKHDFSRFHTFRRACKAFHLLPQIEL